MNEQTLDCQDCGTIIRYLSAAEAQMVADNPYNYIVWCSSCRVRQKWDNDG